MLYPTPWLLSVSLIGCGAAAPASQVAVTTTSETSSEPAQERESAPNACTLELPRNGNVPPDLEERAREFIDIECEASGVGAWRLVFEDLQERPPSPETLEDNPNALTVLDGSWRLVFVGIGGEVARSVPRPLHIDNNLFYDVSRVLAVERYDFDGDGQDELAVSIGRVGYEETGTGSVEVFTVSRGRVLAYAPATQPFPIDRVHDADGDGRPDLISMRPYFLTTHLGLDYELRGGPEHVYRSLPNGRFSDTDVEALTILREACPAPPSQILTPGAGVEEAYDSGGLAVSCARIWGRSGEAISEQIAAELASACTQEGRFATCADLARVLSEHARRLQPPQTLY